MLLEFTVGNFLSFKAPITLSLETSSITDFPENTFKHGRYSLLKSIVIYGANASGKSNLIYAIAEMRKIVKASSKMSSTDVFGVTPFLLHAGMEEKPCFFEILILIDHIRYRYGFEISPTKVHTEWLYWSKAQSEKPLFIREGNVIEVSQNFSEGKGLLEKTRENALFLAVCDQFNGNISGKILKWFTNCNTISGWVHENYRLITSKMLSNEAYRPALLDFLKKLDLGFEEVLVEEERFNPESLPENMPPEKRMRITSELEGKKRLIFKTIHDIYSHEGERTGQRAFDLDTQESSGTNKIFDLLGPFFNTLMDGKVLVVDELDAKLHPLLTRALVFLFNSTEANPLNAQLIFATHDTNLLTYGNFRRDQIYFVEKDNQGATSLYSLIEYKENGGTVRKDRSFENDYVQGKYGAIPYLGDFSTLFQVWQDNKKSLTT
jgi:hypothetical protein